MARYRKIDVRMWGDAKFRSLSPPPPGGQALWWYLLTNPSTTNIPGLYRAGESQIAEELGWPMKGFREAFREVFEQGLVEADWEARLVWIPGAMKYHLPESPNVVKGWATTWDELPECDLKTKAFQLLKAFTEGLGEAFAKAFAKACPKASGKPSRKPKANQEQEQEQEQEQDQKQDVELVRVGDPGSPDPGNGGAPVVGVLLESRKPSKREGREAVVEVVSHYRVHHPRFAPRGLKSDSTEAENIIERLAEGYTVEDLKTSIDGFESDPWHQGVNDRNKPYNSLELYTRDSAHVNEGLELRLRGPPPTAGMNERERQGVLASQIWMAKGTEGG